MAHVRRLFVDGFNVLHAWGWLDARRTKSLAVTCSRLAEEVRAIHDTGAAIVTLVFDGRGEVAQIDAADSTDGFSVIFAPGGKTADSIIEHCVASSPQASDCVVATADALERETVQASGASTISPTELAAWCERCRNHARRKIQSSHGKDFGNKLPL